MPTRLLTCAAVALAALALPLSTQAQDSTGCNCRPRHERVHSEFERRSSGSFAFTQSRPTGELAQNIHFGYGASAAYVFRLDDAGYLSLRADLGLLRYGRESKRVPLSSSIGGRIEVRVATENYVVPVTIGPQLMWPRGFVRPYVHAGIGGQYFWTRSGVEGTDDSYDFASTTNQKDGTTSWMAGGGILFPVYEKKTKVSIDLGAQYFGGGHARYLRPGSIQDLPDAQIRITPLESATNMLLARVGLRVGI